MDCIKNIQLVGFAFLLSFFSVAYAMDSVSFEPKGVPAGYALTLLPAVDGDVPFPGFSGELVAPNHACFALRDTNAKKDIGGLSYSGDAYDDSAYIDILFVDKEYRARERGLGTMLLKNALGYFKKKDFAWAELTAQPIGLDATIGSKEFKKDLGRLVSFYKKFGFAVVGKDDGSAVSMSLDLNGFELE